MTHELSSADRRGPGLGLPRLSVLIDVISGSSFGLSGRHAR